METIEINGKSYLIDIEKATEQGLLKEKDSRPRSWEEYINKQYGENLTRGFNASNFDGRNKLYTRFNTANEAEAFCALGKLIQLRDAWWGDWRPNWSDDESKFCLHQYNNFINVDCYTCTSHVLAFPTEKMGEDFLSTFRDLIEQAKMFL